jgi:hypothetical protein
MRRSTIYVKLKKKRYAIAYQDVIAHPCAIIMCMKLNANLMV